MAVGGWISSVSKSLTVSVIGRWLVLPGYLCRHVQMLMPMMPSPPQVGFKVLPSSRGVAAPAAGSDIRTATTLILFEEFVPLGYRQQLAGNTSSRKRLPSLFSSTKGKQWKLASTLNGQPYMVGHVPHIPSYREVEFEGLLRAKADTKVISLGTVVRSSGISGMSMMNRYSR